MAQTQIITLSNRTKFRDQLFDALNNDWHDVLMGIEAAARLLDSPQACQDPELTTLASWAVSQAQRSAIAIEKAWTDYNSLGQPTD